MRSYPHWKLSCHSNDDGFPVTPIDVKQLINKASKLDLFANLLLYFALGIAVLSLLGWTMSYFKSKNILSTKSASKCSIFRYIFSLLLSMLCLTFVLLMFEITDATTVNYLSKNECSNDAIFNDSFVKMKAYYDSLLLKNWVSIGFISALVLVDIVVITLNCYGSYMNKRRKGQMKAL